MNMDAPWKQYKGFFFYLIFGALTTIINIGGYHLCYEAWGIPNIPSNIIAWILAIAVAYITNKLWVFDSKSFSPKIFVPELWKFLSCRLATGSMDLVIMWLGVDLFHGPATFLKIGSNVLVVLLNYVFSKLIIFEKGESGKHGG